MKKALLYALFSIVLFSCRKKMVDCSALAVKSPCYIALKGYAKDQVDTLIVNRYEPGTHFARRLGSDTLPLPDVRIFNDTAYATGTRACMAALPAGADYEVIVPAYPRTYRIESITYTPDTVLRWTSEKTCGTYGTFSVNPRLVTVNGVPAEPADILHNNTYWITLQR